jgi:diketogulonate reductase-like aldo/keto reductase
VARDAEVDGDGQDPQPRRQQLWHQEPRAVVERRELQGTCRRRPFRSRLYSRDADQFQIVPAVNQIELHPGNPSPKLIAYCAEKGIHCSGYSPLGSADSPLHKNEALVSIAQAKNRSVQQVLLLWGLKKGWSVLPKTVNPDRVKSNFDLDGWDLTPEEVAKIDAIPDRFKVCGDAWLPIKVFFGDDE